MNPEDFKKIRKRLGQTQAGLAEIMGTTETSIRRYERGQQGIPETIARFLQLIEKTERMKRRIEKRSK